MNRKAIAGKIGALLICCFAFMAFSQAVEERVEIATLVGQVEIRAPQAMQWRAGRVGMPVKMGWDVRTYVESSAELRFASGTMLKVAENSVITLSTAMVNKGAGMSQSAVKIATGQLLANVKKLTNTKSSFEFETPTAVASIRGTQLKLSVDKDGTSIDVYEGRVMVRRKGETREVELTTNKHAVIAAGKKDIQVSESTEKRDTTGVKKDTTSRIDTTKGKGKDVPPDTTGRAPAKQDTIKTGEGPGGSTGKLKLAVILPTDNMVITKPLIKVSGTVSPAGARVLVNNAPVVVSGGSFATQIPIADEAGESSVEITAKLGDDEQTVSRTVNYQPLKEPLTLTITSPSNGQKITAKSITVQGKTAAGAKLSINGAAVNLSPSSNQISYDIPLTERDIGDYTIEVVATSDSQEMTKTVAVVVDGSSPQINTSVPVLTVFGVGQQATRVGNLGVQVTDRTPDDQLTLVVENNGTSEETSVESGSRTNIPLDEGKNTYAIKAYDKAKNMSNTVKGEIYYLKGPLTITIKDPEQNPLLFDVPPMPRGVGRSPLHVEAEVDDGIGNIPKTIKYCRVLGAGESINLKDNGDYTFTGELNLARGQNVFTLQAEDLAGNIATKTLTVVVK